MIFGAAILASTRRRFRRVNAALVVALLAALAGANATNARADSAVAWGANNFALIGDGTTADRRAPTAVTGMGSGVTALAAAPTHSLAVQHGGVFARGSNGTGALGDGTRTPRLTPVAATGLDSGVTAVAATAGASFAIKDGGAYYYSARLILRKTPKLASLLVFEGCKEDVASTPTSWLPDSSSSSSTLTAASSATQSRG